jgi:hypothetical protein
MNFLDNFLKSYKQLNGCGELAETHTSIVVQFRVAVTSTTQIQRIATHPF